MKTFAITLATFAALAVLSGCMGEASGETPQQLPVSEEQKAQIEQGQTQGEPESVNNTESAE